jgi:hypothetical protein
MLAIMMSPATTPVGLVMVTEAVVVLVAVVAVPRWAICADTSCPSPSPSRKINVFTVVVSEEKRRRCVSMDEKKLVFSFRPVANLLQLVDEKNRINKELIWVCRFEVFLQVH